MKRILKQLICFVVCICIAVTSFSVMALTQSEKDKLNSDIANLKQQASSIQAEINKLKAEKAEKGAILAAIRKKIANTQAQIDRCNQEIEAINTSIEKNNQEIAQKEDEIAADKLAFQKRIRAIYMSNSDSSVQILMGAEDFLIPISNKLTSSLQVFSFMPFLSAIGFSFCAISIIIS